jgi:hypothetical protein
MHKAARPDTGVAEYLFEAANVRFAVFRTPTGGCFAVDQEDPRPGTVLPTPPAPMGQQQCHHRLQEVRQRHMTL